MKLPALPPKDLSIIYAWAWGLAIAFLLTNVVILALGSIFFFYWAWSVDEPTLDYIGSEIDNGAPPKVET